MAAEDITARLAAARERKAAREQAKEDALKLLELQALELEEKLTADLGGGLGDKFAILVTDFGLFAVKHVPSATALYKRITTQKGDITPEDADAFVRPCVCFPDIDKFNTVTADRPAITTLLSVKLMDLFGAVEAASRSKF